MTDEFAARLNRRDSTGEP